MSIPVSRAELMAYLDHLGIMTSTTDHEAVFTVSESEALERNLPGRHTKNLFLRDAKGNLFLVVAEAHAKIQMNALHRKLDCARLSFGKPDLLLEVLGVPAGSVTAFAVLNDRSHQVTLVIDKTLADADIINCHPMTNTATTTISRDDLMRFFAATGHKPRIVDFDAPSPAYSP